MKRKLVLALLFATWGVFSISPGIANAECGDGTTRGGRAFLGLPTWDRGLDCSDDAITPDSISSAEGNPLLVILENITAAALQLAGYVSVLFVVVGGFKYVMSEGDPQKTKDARQTIINALIGGGIAALALIIVEATRRAFLGGS